MKGYNLTAAVPGLVNCLNDNQKPLQAEKHVCDIAAEALEQIGTPEAIVAVEKRKRSQGEVMP